MKALCIFFLFPLVLWGQTERGFTGKYVFTQTPGIYRCAGCHSPLFRSEDKYQIGCGWATFTRAHPSKSVYFLEDWKMEFKRYEVLCRKCDAHLGHVFNDGPPPKHLRFTINSLALELEQTSPAEPSVLLPIEAPTKRP